MNRLRLLTMFFLLLAGTSTLMAQSAATVKTDLDDYPPGSTAYITGAGFQAGETVTLQVLHVGETGDNAYSGAHAPWDVVADENGNISSSWLVPLDEDELGATLLLKATGQSSGLYAEWTFTDGISIASISVGSQSTTPTYGTSSSATYSVTIARTSGGAGGNSAFNATISTSTLPAGVTISPTTVAFATNVASVTFNLTLTTTTATPAGTSTFTVTAVGTSGVTSSNVTLTINKAPSVTTVTISGAPFTYSGSPITPATVSVTGAGGLSLTPTAVYANNTNAGVNTASASYTFTGDANHLGSSDSMNFTIDKATSATVVTISGAPFTYIGSPITPATVSVTGAGGLSLTPSAVYANNTNAGVNTASASYTYSGDANHLGSNDSKSFTINKATSNTVITINGAPFIYTGSAQTPATVLVTGAGSLSLTPTADYANNTDAGTATASYSYAGDANHEGSSDGENFEIGKAPSVTIITIAGATFTYTGSEITPATVSVTGVGSLNLTPTADYANNVNAGTATASYTYTGDNNHEGSSDSENFEIGKAATITTVAINGGPFTYTGSAITPATVTVIGANLSLTPDAEYSNNINAGSATASYTYAGDANHEGSSDSKDFEIGKAASITTVTINGGPFTFTYTGSAITPATVTVIGANLSLTPDAEYTNNINAGTATASYTYSGDANHEGSSDTKDFEIGKAATITTVAINGGPFTYTGSSITPATVTVAGANLSLTPDAEYSNNINAGTATASYSYAGDANHEGSSDSKDFEIGKAATITTVTINGGPFTYTGSAITPATVTVTGANLSLTPNAEYTSNINAGTATASYSYLGDANHEGSSNSKNFAIGKAATVTTLTINGGPFTYTGSAITPATVTVEGANLSLTPDANYVSNINAGTATASYSYAGDDNHAGSNDTKNFTIGQKAATVVANDKTKTYGDSNPMLDAAVTGTVLNDVLNYSLSTTALPLSGVGNYPISITLGSNPNYNISTTNATLTVIKRVASVTPAANSKFCGQIDPVFSGTLNGFITADGVTATYSRVAGETVSGNPYTISAVLNPVAALSNYTITYNTASFTINGITIDASASSAPIAVGTTAILKATVSPAAAGIPVVFTLDNGNGGITTYTATTDANGLATTSAPGLTVEVYQVTATAGNACAVGTAYLPVYDPNGGFVTGGGWINSPAGAYQADLTLVGKANFGFVSKYKKGSNEVDGNTEFQFQAGNLNFKSTSNLAASLVVAGSQAIYKGTGTINGAGSYTFMVSVVDGNVSGGGGTDKFRIKISGSGGLVYDNQVGAADNATAITVIGGGSIVIQGTKSAKRDATPVEAAEAQEMLISTVSVYPNPVEEVIHVKFASQSTSPIAMQLIDLNGRSLKTESYSVNEEGLYEMPVSNLAMNTGFYLLRIAQDKATKTIKLYKR